MTRGASASRRPGVVWVALCAALAVLALGAAGLALPHALDWQPDRWRGEPWRWWTAAFVHLSPQHLWANVAATVLVAALGWLVALPTRAAAAWAVAWPLTHLGLLSMPALRHYGGLSGILHGAVAVIAVHLVWHGRGRERVVGGLLLVGLVAKVLMETPWRAAVQVSPHWDIPVAPIAHLTGAVAGLACALAAELLTRKSHA